LGDQNSGVADAAWTQSSPEFIWLLRDFSLKNVYDSPYHYMEAQLNESNNSAAQRNVSKVTVKTYFPRRHCIMLPHPGLTEKKMQHMELISFDELPPKFSQGIEQLERLVDELMPVSPKRLCGRVLTAQQWVQFEFPLSL